MLTRDTQGGRPNPTMMPSTRTSAVAAQSRRLVPQQRQPAPGADQSRPRHPRATPDAQVLVEILAKLIRNDDPHGLRSVAEIFGAATSKAANSPTHRARFTILRVVAVQGVMLHSAEPPPRSKQSDYVGAFGAVLGATPLSHDKEALACLVLAPVLAIRWRSKGMLRELCALLDKAYPQHHRLSRNWGDDQGIFMAIRELIVQALEGA